MTFDDCVRACASNPQYMAHWIRLRRLRPPSSMMDILVDRATGHYEHLAALFIADVRDLVWNRLPPDRREGR
jgi:hypothetical protein